MSRPLVPRSAARAHDEHYGPNMTPMVDVVMVILVFFMASTALMGPEWILRSSVAPEARPAAPAVSVGPAEFVVRIGVAGGSALVHGLGLDGAPLSSLSSAASAAAEALGPGIAHARLVIEPESAVPYDAIVRVQEMLLDAGFRDVSLR